MKLNEDINNQTHQTAEPGERSKVIIVRCAHCGSSITYAPEYIADTCPFCNSKINLSSSMEDRIYKPHSLLSHTISQEDAREIFDCWIESRNFAPNPLKEVNSSNIQIAGIFLPYWMFDGDAQMIYEEKRGFDKSILKSIRNAKINGRLSTELNDVLIGSSDSLPKKALNITEPSDTDHLTPNEEKILNGFVTERYILDLKTGLLKKQDLIDAETTNLIRGEIFWNQQRKYILSHLAGEIESNSPIPQFETNYKLMLLPLWYGSYELDGEEYNFIIHGRTGKIHGQRPYSHLKGVMLLISILLVLTIIFGYAILQKVN